MIGEIIIFRYVRFRFTLPKSRLWIRLFSISRLQQTTKGWIEWERERKVRLFRKGVENVGSTKGVHFKTSDSTAAKIERLGVRIRQFQSKLESLTWKRWREWWATWISMLSVEICLDWALHKCPSTRHQVLLNNTLNPSNSELPYPVPQPKSFEDPEHQTWAEK